MEDYVTLGEAARMLGYSYQNVRRWWLRGRIPYQRAGVAVLVRLSDVQAAMKDF